MSNGSSFLWIGVISANIKGSGKALILRESFIHLHRTCGSIFFPFKILREMSPPEDFTSSNVEITSRTSLGVTSQTKKKGLNVMYLLLIFFIVGWFLYLLIIFLIGSGLFKDSDEWGHFYNPRDDVMDWKWILNSPATSISFKIKLSLSESIMFPEVFIPLFEK